MNLLKDKFLFNYMNHLQKRGRGGVFIRFCGLWKKRPIFVPRMPKRLPTQRRLSRPLTFPELGTVLDNISKKLLNPELRSNRAIC